jgi:crossover junction endodeoxyribonuclease RuvC
MYVLWIDPGIRKLWYALVDDQMCVVDAGVLLQDDKNLTREKQFARMEQIYAFFAKMLVDYPISAIGMEKLYFTDRNMNNAEFVYGIRGALAMLFVTNKLPLYEWTPNEIKKRVTGNGNASKELMVNVITRLYQLAEAPKRHDTADAMWLAWMILKRLEW